MSEELPARGVDNPRVVDLITKNPETGEVVLVMIEPRPWGAHPDQILQIQEKFNAYLSYVTTGFLEREYPQYAGHRVAFQLDCVAEPEGDPKRFLEGAREFAAQDDIRFVVNVDPNATAEVPSPGGDR